ncbi:MAG: HPr family phosphocarrier protein, partial [Lachnospiraceae bacterium]|nr:HPr family phosphocarrier protein [Lachnospiraceae bacterium]
MTERKIMLRMDEVKDFVSAASKCDFDIDIFYNRYSVDAKSIL